MTDLSQLQRDSQIRTTALVVLTFIAVAAALYFLRPVLLPFVLALFIASGLAPLLNAVQKYLESSRAVAIFVTAVLSATVTVVLWMIIAFSVKEMLSTSGPFSAGFNAMINRIGSILETVYPAEAGRQSAAAADAAAERPLVAAVERPLAASGEETLQELLAPTDDPLAPLAAASADEGVSGLEVVRRFFQDRMERIILMVTNELFVVFSSGLLVMIFLFFLLLGGSHVTLPENNIWRDVDTHVRQYIVAKTFISAVTGFLFGLVMWLFGVPLAFVLGMLAFMLNFIPNLGPIIASLLPVPLVWMLVEATAADESVGYGVTRAILAIGIGAVVQFISGNVIEPKIMGDQFRLHPIAILLSLMFWYMIWGLVGAFLAVPITSALKIIFAELESTRPAAELLEGNLSILARKSQTSDSTA